MWAGHLSMIGVVPWLLATTSNSQIVTVAIMVARNMFTYLIELDFLHDWFINLTLPPPHRLPNSRNRDLLRKMVTDRVYMIQLPLMRVGSIDWTSDYSLHGPPTACWHHRWNRGLLRKIFTPQRQEGNCIYCTTVVWLLATPPVYVHFVVQNKTDLSRDVYRPVKTR